jgi:hypothetical protein
MRKFITTGIMTAALITIAGGTAAYAVLGQSHFVRSQGYCGRHMLAPPLLREQGSTSIRWTPLKVFWVRHLTFFEVFIGPSGIAAR